MIALKTDYAYGWLNDFAQITDNDDNAAGFYYFDMRHLSRYIWNFMPKAKCLARRYHSNRVHQIWSISPDDVKGEVIIERYITMNAQGFTDKLFFRNDTDHNYALEAKLELDADFQDMFGLRVHWSCDQSQTANYIFSSHQHIWQYTAFDAVKLSTEVTANPPINNDKKWAFHLKPKGCENIEVRVNFSSSLAHHGVPILKKDDWHAQFTQIPQNPIYAKAYKQAREDLYYLLLSTEQGLYAAAGIPWFVTAFGRDGLLTANMLLKNCPELTEGTLLYLAARQGKKADAYYEEERGKILHEVRNCELARKKEIPFLTYYGTADATGLWVKLLADHYRQEKNLSFIKELLPNLSEALYWLENKIADTGFVQYLPEGSGLMNQSWKDASDANPHADGKLAEMPLAVVEVQGYTYAAFKGAAEIFTALGDHDAAQKYHQLAKDMYDRIQKHYWLDELNNYAIALDKFGKPLKVNASNSGHLLWCEAVPKDKAKKLIDTLMGSDMYSGWGIRTLSRKEVAYNPLSYHTGCVWPHDTALAAHGMLKYGYRDIYTKITCDICDLAEAMGDYILPELTSGLERRDDNLNVPYIQSCRPQAWAAAALLSLCENL